MKARTQMRIGLWGTIALLVFGLYQFIRLLPSASLITLLGMLVSIILFTIYIFSIVRKKLKSTQRVYRIWWVLGLVELSILFIGLLVAGKWTENLQATLTVLIIFLCFALPFGFMTLVLWIGLRGLERILGPENKSNADKLIGSEGPKNK